MRLECWSLLLTASNRIADKVKHVRHVVRTAVVPPEQRTIDQLLPGCSKRLPCPGRCLRFGDDLSASKSVECSTHRQDREGLKFAGTQPLRMIELLVPVVGHTVNHRRPQLGFEHWIKQRLRRWSPEHDSCLSHKMTQDDPVAPEFNHEQAMRLSTEGVVGIGCIRAAQGSLGEIETFQSRRIAQAARDQTRMHVAQCSDPSRGPQSAPLLVSEKRCPLPYSTDKGGPSNSIPWARHTPGSCGGIAFALVTSRKKASIFPAGKNATRIRPRAEPTKAQTWGTRRGASSESPGWRRKRSAPTSNWNLPSRT